MRSTLVNGLYRSLWAGALLSLGAGCGDGDDRGAVTEVSEGINGELVYSLEQGPEHTIQFFDFDNGERNGVYEIMNVGDKSVLGDGTQAEGHSLADIFRKLRPEQQIPERIAAADRRMLQARKLRQAMTPDPHWVTAEPTKAPSTLDRAGEGLASAAATCSADLLADGWGGQWFKDTNCLNNCDPLYFMCDANRGSARWSAAASDYFAYRQMEGDFAVAGRVESYTTGFPYPAPKYWFSTALQPRKIGTWWFSGSGVSWQTNYFTGNSPCGHLHNTRRVCD